MSFLEKQSLAEFLKSCRDDAALYKSHITAVNWSWIWADEPPAAIDSPDGFHARMQFRHRMEDIPCVVKR